MRMSVTRRFCLKALGKLFQSRRRIRASFSIFVYRVHPWIEWENFNQESVSSVRRACLVHHFAEVRFFSRYFCFKLAMSSRGGRRIGSGRKRIYDSSTTRLKVWQKGHQRIWLDHIIYSSWVSAKMKCGYSTDTAFAGHLLSLEQRRR